MAFQGWQRKTGLFTLVLACLLMAGWIRSRTICDFVSIFSSDHQALYDLSSTRMGLMFMVTRGDFTGQRKTITLASRKWNYPPGKDLLSGEKMNWRIDFCGLKIGGNGHRNRQQMTEIGVWIIPYWSITIALTLASGSLLIGSSLRGVRCAAPT